MTRNLTRLGIAGLVLLLLLAHGASTSRVHSYRGSIEFHDHLEAPLMPGPMLKILAGEFKGLTADFLVLEIGAYMDKERTLTSQEMDRVYFHFSQAMDLDPYFSQTYQMIQAFLPWNGKAEEANRLLAISREKLPWDWFPGFYLGFNHFYFLKNYDEAARILFETSTMDGAPAMLATLAARFSQKTGKTRASLAFLKTMKANPEYGENTKKLIQMRIDVLEAVAMLESAIAVYERTFGKPIQTLDDLVAAGIISEIPVHAESRQFTYENGRVGF